MSLFPLRKLPLLHSYDEHLLDEINTGRWLAIRDRAHPLDRRQLVDRAERMVALHLVYRLITGDYAATQRGRRYLRLRYQNGPGPQEEFIARMGRGLVV
jgi:hypothetical protein